MTTRAEPTRLDRWSGACLIAAGILILPGMLHPDIFETTLADAALGSALWVPMHVAALVVVVLSLVGLSGLYAPRAERLGRLGGVGFGLVVPGLVMTGAVAWAEALLLPVIAREDPAVFAWDGPVTTSWAVRVTTGLAVLWLVGLSLLAFAAWRTRLLPAAPALTLGAASLAWTVFGGLLLPVVGPASTLVLAVGYGWVGLALWTGATGSATAGGRTPGPAYVESGGRPD